MVTNNQQRNNLETHVNEQTNIIRQLQTQLQELVKNLKQGFEEKLEQRMKGEALLSVCLQSGAIFDRKHDRKVLICGYTEEEDCWCEATDAIKSVYQDDRDDPVINEERDHEEFLAKLVVPSLQIHHLSDQLIHGKVNSLPACDDSSFNLVENTATLCTNKIETVCACNVFDKIPERKGYITAFKPDSPDGFDQFVTAMKQPFPNPKPEHQRKVLICGANQEDDCLCIVTESMGLYYDENDDLDEVVLDFEEEEVNQIQLQNQLFNPVIKDDGDEEGFKEKILDPVPLNNQVEELNEQVKGKVFDEMPRSVLNSGYAKKEGYLYVITHQYPPKYNDSGGGTEIPMSVLCVLTNKPKELSVDIESANDTDKLVVVEYAEDMYKFYKLAEKDSQIFDYIDSQLEENKRMVQIFRLDNFVVVQSGNHVLGIDLGTNSCVSTMDNNVGEIFHANIKGFGRRFIKKFNMLQYGCSIKGKCHKIINIAPTEQKEHVFKLFQRVTRIVFEVTARFQARRYTFLYQERMHVEHLVQFLCDTKQGYTQSCGLRPFGVSFLVTNGPQVVNEQDMGVDVIQDKGPKFILDKMAVVENFNNADNSSNNADNHSNSADNSSMEQEQQDIIAQKLEEYQERDQRESYNVLKSLFEAVQPHTCYMPFVFIVDVLFLYKGCYTNKRIQIIKGTIFDGFNPNANGGKKEEIKIDFWKTTHWKYLVHGELFFLQFLYWHAFEGKNGFVFINEVAFSALYANICVESYVCTKWNHGGFSRWWLYFILGVQFPIEMRSALEQNQSQVVCEDDISYMNTILVVNVSFDFSTNTFKRFTMVPIQVPDMCLALEEFHSLMKSPFFYTDTTMISTRTTNTNDLVNMHGSTKNVWVTRDDVTVQQIKITHGNGKESTYCEVTKRGPSMKRNDNIWTSELKESGLYWGVIFDPGGIILLLIAEECRNTLKCHLEDKKVVNRWGNGIELIETKLVVVVVVMEKNNTVGAIVTLCGSAENELNISNYMNSTNNLQLLKVKEFLV